MSDPFNYCPDEVHVLIGGIVPINGFLDGTFVSITKDVVPFSSQTTPDGTIARIYNRSQTYTVQITVHNGSKSNDLLTKLWQLDEITDGRGKFPILIKDFSGSDLLFSTTAWIEGLPSLVKSNGIDGRTWDIRCSKAFVNIGSNAEPSSLIEDIINTAVSALPALDGII